MYIRVHTFPVLRIRYKQSALKLKKKKKILLHYIILNDYGDDDDNYI